MHCSMNFAISGQCGGSLGAVRTLTWPRLATPVSAGQGGEPGPHGSFLKKGGPS